MLLFDEADALFGKRSEVTDARDRYANVEVAYLLQRMEPFDGIAILTTNLRANIDEAFTRRLDVVVDFPLPDEADRLRLWQINLPAAGAARGRRRPRVPRARVRARRRQHPQRLRVRGASSRPTRGRLVTMADLVRGVAIEYRKLGRMCTASEFGPYLELAQPESLRPAPIGA